ncbi:TlpA family protein disulfide reductase [Ichthyenterobacterium magnum]|uniref:AhpC/TSA family protein n=1 Tax=Ichthyenterobacterium magnum TaxID=1230530 RepID=A0A420DMI3_9FLAO|nr:TlpA disulfide reductase family protein [Ichthyenterobacterium magnum]RKE95452.1 AhpC/TSA family protein [Ichthyenterobacterium magnum]
MKRLLLLSLCFITIIACKEAPKDYVTISGKITNPDDSKTLKIFKGKEFEKVITLNDDGTFSDTLKVAKGDYSINHGQEYGNIYLENGFVASFDTDYEDFDNTIAYKGDGADINNFVIKSYLISGDYFTDELVSEGSQDDLDKAIADYKAGFKALQDSYPGLDSLHIANGEQSMNGNITSLKRYMSGKLALRKAFPKGSASPTFENYENYKGGTTSLADLKGKYVYVDVWATWCGPCKREIPSLKKVEKQFHGKNIEFVSISVDNGRGYKEKTVEASKEGWKKMIKEKELGGIQLFADNAFNSDFVKNYKINGIPRFILIDPQGNIVSADAPRPSNPKLIELFNTLNI